MRPVISASITRERAIPAVSWAADISLRHEKHHVVSSCCLSEPIVPTEHVYSESCSSVKKNHELAVGRNASIWIVNPSICSHSRCTPMIVVNELSLVKLEKSTNLCPFIIPSVQLAKSWVSQKCWIDKVECGFVIDLVEIMSLGRVNNIFDVCIGSTTWQFIENLLLSYLLESVSITSKDVQWGSL